MTTRTIRAESPGPANIKASLPGASLTVIVEPGREYAEITVGTAAEKGPSADQVRDATMEVRGNNLTVRFPRGGGSSMSIVSGNVQVNNFGGVTVSGNSYGVISTGRGVHIQGATGPVYVNGRLVTGEGDSDLGANPFAPIEVVARVPEMSNVDFNSSGGDLYAEGRLGNVEADTSGGNITIDNVQTADARSSGGNVTVNYVQTRAKLRSSGGNVTVYGADGADVRARSSGGNVTHGGNLDCDASSSGGRVRSVPVNRP